MLQLCEYTIFARNRLFGPQHTADILARPALGAAFLGKGKTRRPVIYALRSGCGHAIHDDGRTRSCRRILWRRDRSKRDRSVNSRFLATAFLGAMIEAPIFSAILPPFPASAPGRFHVTRGHMETASANRQCQASMTVGGGRPGSGRISSPANSNQATLNLCPLIKTNHWTSGFRDRKWLLSQGCSRVNFPPLGPRSRP
jgi:hypothetical protein